MWRHLGGGLGGEKKIMTTPRLIRFRFNDTQKPMDVISDFVVIINPHVYFFFSRLLPFHFPWLHIRSLSFAFLPVFVTTVVCRPNHRRKNVTPRTVLLWSMYICIYTYVYTLANALGQKYISCSFPFLCQSRRGTPGVRDENRETSERKCVREI